MAGQKRDAKWLKEQLSRVLGWDEMIVEGLVDAVVRAAGPGGDRAELDQMVENFMADSPAGIKLINDFLAPPPQRGGGGGGSGSGVGGSGAGGSGSRAAASAAAVAAGGGSGGGKSYAASASTALPTGAPRHHHQQNQQHPQQHGRNQRQQQPAVSSSSALASSTPPGWQTLGPAGGGGSSSSTSSAAAAAAAKGGAAGVDDFSRFVVDDRAGGGSGGKGAGIRSKPGSSRDLQALEAGAAGAEKPPNTADGAGGKVLGMFKAGGRIKAPSAKPVGMRSPDGGALAVASSLERQVINCLGCGKIYDCRSVTNDILKFLDRGGVCTFCGDTVPLSYKDRQKAAAAAAEAAGAADGDGRDLQAADGAAGSGGAADGGGEDAAVAAARAFKDRLVEYDRNAAKRTTVIDDQSDFFEIDTNAWLTDQEREELRRRRQLEEEAEATRRKRRTVTIDLIGRTVVLDEDVRKAEEKGALAAAERAAAAAAAKAAEVLRNTDGDGSGSAYGSGVAFSGNAMGGMGGGPTREQLDAALGALRRMKATINPAIAASAAPLFLPAAAKAAGGAADKGTASKSPAGGSGGATPPAAAAGTAGGSCRTAPAAGSSSVSRGSSGAKGGAGSGARGRPAGQQERRHDRVQHDLRAEYGFDAFGAEVALDELMGGALLDASEQDGPYDICPPDMAPSTSYSSAATSTASRAGGVPRPVSGLPPGVVILKSFLTIDEQIKIVTHIRDLGVGQGGFYVPSYSSGGRLALRMMCMGLHWEPRTSKYEPTRSSYDGATPPPIPPWLAELCERCLTTASASTAGDGGARFPPLHPDICLANFYERSGRLGMHQDKDEMADSLRAGLPVVSLSLGDAADFLYGRTRDVDQAGSVRLESGDLLVFGGPGRMMYHSVAKIHPNTAPSELIRSTGLRPGRLNLTFRQYRAAASG